MKSDSAFRLFRRRVHQLLEHLSDRVYLCIVNLNGLSQFRKLLD
jgi:hypothetical protein